MSSAFGPSYAAAYDALYGDKDYEAECDFLEQVFAASGRQVQSVLDLGSGTGAHANRLAVRGYDVVGVDLSAPMVEIARHQAEASPARRAEYVQADIRSVRLERQFDAVICMFAVLGYQTADDDVANALETARVHLGDGGPFIFDVWYGPAVESIEPSTRIKAVKGDGVEIERAASAVLDRDRHLCTVSYRLIARRPGLPDDVTEELHQMRYFFDDEIGRFLREAQLELRELVPFPETTAPLSAAEWNVVGVAKG